jgi:transcriptional regulator with XRE-family HTH domain
MPAFAELPERLARLLSLFEINRDDLDVCRGEQSVKRPHAIRPMSRFKNHRSLNEARGLEALGERLRLARLRRRLAIDITCERAGISRMTLYRAEAGSPAIALGTLVRILSVLGLQSDLDQVASDDKVGRLLQDLELKPRRHKRVATKQVTSHE